MGRLTEWYKESWFDEVVVVIRAVVIGIFIVFLITGSEQVIAAVKTGDWKIMVSMEWYGTPSVEK